MNKHMERAMSAAGFFSFYSLLVVLNACSGASFEKLPDPPVPHCNNFHEACVSTTGPGNKKINHFDYEQIQQERKVDILFVDDNSKSMAEEQKRMATAFNGFIDSLAGISWRIGITTTDVTGSNGGRLLDLQPGIGLFVLSPTIPDNVALFSKAIQRSELGSGDERGIYAINLLLDRAGQSSEPDFLRPATHFAVVVLSDEDERSTGANLEDYDKPETLVTRFDAKYRGEKSMSVHSIVIKPGDIDCLTKQKSQESTGREGKVYAAATEKTGGFLGSICETSYTSQLTSIADKIDVNIDTFTLACSPIDGKIDLTFNSKPVPASEYGLAGDKLTLNNPPVPGTKVAFKYSCYAN